MVCSHCSALPRPWCAQHQVPQAAPFRNDHQVSLLQWGGEGGSGALEQPCTAPAMSFPHVHTAAKHTRITLTSPLDAGDSWAAGTTMPTSSRVTTTSPKCCSTGPARRCIKVNGVVKWAPLGVRSPDACSALSQFCHLLHWPTLYLELTLHLMPLSMQSVTWQRWRCKRSTRH